MPVPLLPLVGNVAVRVITSPMTWSYVGKALLILGIGVVSLKVIFGQAIETVMSLWWVVVLFFVLGLVKVTFPIYVSEREATKREALKLKGHNDQP